MAGYKPATARDDVKSASGAGSNSKASSSSSSSKASDDDDDNEQEDEAQQQSGTDQEYVEVEIDNMLLHWVFCPFDRGVWIFGIPAGLVCTLQVRFWALRCAQSSKVNRSFC